MTLATLASKKETRRKKKDTYVYLQIVPERGDFEPGRVLLQAGQHRGPDLTDHVVPERERSDHQRHLEH